MHPYITTVLWYVHVYEPVLDLQPGRQRPPLAAFRVPLAPAVPRSKYQDGQDERYNREKQCRYKWSDITGVCEASCGVEADR